MTAIKLNYKLYHKWKSDNQISVLGSAYLNNHLLSDNTLIDYFKEVTDEDLFVSKLKTLSGHFSVVIELESFLFAAVDIIRTFPLFFRVNNNNVVLSDKIESDFIFNESECINFSKVYCTLENNTLLKNWKQLLAGEYLVINKSNLHTAIKTYYQHALKSEQKSDIELKYNLAALEKIITGNIFEYAKNRTILVPLSGGYDSRYLLALLKKNNYSKIECFTYGKKNSYEVLIAKNVAEKLNVKWHFIEYTNELIDVFFSDEWMEYSSQNHHFSSLPHEQEFFALHYLKQNKLLPENAVIMNGFCQDIQAGSFLEPVTKFDFNKFIFHKHQLKLNNTIYENSWNGYQEWLVKNRLSKFIINSVRVYEFFGLDFYLPFWNKDWIDFWYSMDMENRLNQKFYNNYLFKGIFKQYKIDFKKPTHDTAYSFYTLKKIAKSILPKQITEQISIQNSLNKQNDVNNTLYLYEKIYCSLNNKPDSKDYKINNIHAVYFLEKIKNLK
jgi:asparagine synthase (glutamine-hydrolysing)